MIKKELETRKKFNHLKMYYDKTWDPHSHTLHVGIFTSKHDTLAQSYVHATDYLEGKINEHNPLTSESVILDVGCGTGRTLINMCAKYDCEGVGVDISDEQIKDAKNYLKELNKTSKKKINCRFICGSASSIDSLIKGKEKFSHIISQDALLLVINKKRCYEGLYRLLQPDGIFAIADFVSESVINNQHEKKFVNGLVNWEEKLSFEKYSELLHTIGFDVAHAERRNKDMILTYEKLADEIMPFINEDTIYSDLQKRYKAIVKSVQAEKMGWSIFVAKKPRKKVLIVGTKQKSIGRYIGTYLHKHGWEVWLHSRTARHVDQGTWHERSCDISKESDIHSLLQEMGTVDACLYLADTKGGHSELTTLTEEEILGKVSAKVTGNLLLTKAIMNKKVASESPTKLIWLSSTSGNLPAHLILYSVINFGVAGFINELNYHYKHLVKAYFVPTPPILNTTLGDAYIKIHGGKEKAKKKQYVLSMVLPILNDEVKTKIVLNNKRNSNLHTDARTIMNTRRKLV